MNDQHKITKCEQTSNKRKKELDLYSLTIESKYLIKKKKTLWREKGLCNRQM